MRYIRSLFVAMICAVAACSTPAFAVNGAPYAGQVFQAYTYCSTAKSVAKIAGYYQAYNRPTEGDAIFNKYVKDGTCVELKSAVILALTKNLGGGYTTAGRIVDVWQAKLFMPRKAERAIVYVMVPR